MKQRDFRDRDFLATNEGLLFCVVGPYHPPDRVIGYLKYLPDPKGKWRKGDNWYKRVMRTYTIPSLLETFDLLKNDYPQYLFFSSVYSITMTAVPLENIVNHFKPERKLKELIEAQYLDSLQKKVLRLVTLLSKIGSIKEDNHGVTGSILLGIHNPAFSDMDITVYGVDSSYAIKNALRIACSTKNNDVERISGEKLRKWYNSKTVNHPISMVEVKRIYERKWNIGVFDGTPFSVHSVKLEDELTEKYGDKTYHPAGMVTIRAVVADCKNSIFLPAVYQVKEVEGEIDAEIEEVVSYEGLYDSLADKDETIEVMGKLEHVFDSRTDRKYDRVLVGSPEGKGREYIKPVA